MTASLLLPEMILGVIDHLHDDKESLQACSLVCKAWTHAARLHLFSTVTVELPLEPAVFPYVRDLLISVNVDLSHPASTWEEVIPLLVGFDRTVTLRINISWRSLEVISLQSWLTLSKNFPRVESLIIMNFTCADVSFLARIFCSFPCLRRLFIYGHISSQSTEPASTMTLRLPPNLDVLKLVSVDTNALYEWFLSLPVRPAFRTIRLCYLHGSTMAGFHRFITAIGNNVEVLSFGHHLEGVHPTIDLSPLTQLRSIEFQIPFSSVYCHWVSQTLSCISSAPLEDVILTVELFNSDIIANAVDWNTVDTVLQHSKFSRLRNVYYRQLSYYPLYTGIIQCLPLCYARGILRVESVDQPGFWE